MSRRERFRSHHRVPLTWELPTLVALGGTLLLLAVPLVVQGVTCLVTVGQFAWPTGHELDALRAILDGRFGVGLDTNVRASLPPSRVLLVISALSEVVVAIAMVLVCHMTLGAGARHGLASRQQASASLGERALRRKARTIRPDLATRRRTRPDRGGRP